MADDKAKTGTADDIRINSNESYDLRYWSEKFGATREKLLDKIKAVGPRVSTVCRKLNK